MYIINVDDLPQDKLFKCNGVVAKWLMKEKNFPLLGKSKDGSFVFSKTELLLEVLERIPFYIDIKRLFK